MKPRILFVDDEPNILDGLRRMLRGMRNEWEMSFALGGVAALQELAARPVDVIVSDMRMPDIQGSDLLREVRQEYPNVIRMVLSGQCETDAVYKVVGSCHQFLSKPCDTEALAKAVRRTLALRNLVSSDQLRGQIASLPSLPTPPAIYRRLVELLSAESQSLKEVCALIKQDLALAAKIMQLANSGYFGIGRTIDTPEQAVNLLGLDTISVLVLSQGVLSAFEAGAAPTEIYRNVSAHSLACARIAKEIAQAEGLTERSVGNAFVAGLMHDIGILVLASSPILNYRELYEKSRGDLSTLCQKELAAIGDSHATVGAYLLTLWGFPEAVVDAVAFHESPREAHAHGFDVLTAVYLAIALLPNHSTRTAVRGLLDRVDLDYLNEIGALKATERCAATYAPAS